MKEVVVQLEECLSSFLERRLANAEILRSRRYLSRCWAPPKAALLEGACSLFLNAWSPVTLLSGFSLTLSRDHLHMWQGRRTTVFLTTNKGAGIFFPALRWAAVLKVVPMRWRHDGATTCGDEVVTISSLSLGETLQSSPELWLSWAHCRCATEYPCLNGISSYFPFKKNYCSCGHNLELYGKRCMCPIKIWRVLQKGSWAVAKGTAKEWRKRLLSVDCQRFFNRSFNLPDFIERYGQWNLESIRCFSNPLMNSVQFCVFKRKW